MSAPAENILLNIRDTLRAIAELGPVSLGGAHDSHELPRVELGVAGLADAAADDQADTQAATLEVTLRLYLRDGREALARALALAELARAALMTDPFRGGLARQTAAGPATQVGPSRVERSIDSPSLCLVLPVRCRFLQEVC
jgi:hypothetical protein